MGDPFGCPVTERRGVAHWIGLACGGAVIVYGTLGLVHHASNAALQQVVTWMFGADLLHDLVIAPLVCLVGLTAARWTPAAWRWPVRAGLVTSTLVLAVGYPVLRGFGRHRVPNNRSVLPLDYTSAVATVLAVVWALVTIWGIASWRTTKRGREPS
jgi:hypothetical protein